MNKNNSIYEKALKYYSKGEFNKSLKLCENAVGNGVKNRDIFNLKGIIYYIQGDIKNSEISWRVSCEIFKDPLAKGYLKDLKVDEKKIVLYEEALKLIKNMEITRALSILEQCSKSDFNAINVYNALAFCFIRKGEFQKAESAINKVLSIQPKNEIALKNLKEIKGLDKESRIPKKIIISLSSVIVCVILVWVVFFKNGTEKIVLEDKKVVTEENVEKEEQKEAEKTNEGEKAQQESVVEEVKKEEPKFDAEGFSKLVENKDYNKIYELIENTKKEELKDSDKFVLENGVKLLKSEGALNFYDTGREALSKGEYDNANGNFNKCLKYLDNNKEMEYLKPHIIYMLGTSEEAKSNFENAIKYYKEYIKDNKGKEYEAEALYRLANLYKDIDINKSIQYGERIKDRYSDSIYYNKVIKEILK